MSRRTYDHLPEWDECRKRYALAQDYFNPPEENGIGVHRVLNLTEGLGFRGGLQYLSIQKFKRLLELFRKEWRDLMRRKENGEDIPEDEEYRYGKNNRQRGERNNSSKRSYAYSTNAKVQSKLDRKRGGTVSHKKIVKEIPKNAEVIQPRLF